MNDLIKVEYPGSVQLTDTALMLRDRALETAALVARVSNHDEQVVAVDAQ